MMTPQTMESEPLLTADQLAEAFQAFERASDAMSRHYEALQQRVAELNLELEHKNEDLRQSLAEREAFSRYLASLLESLTDGVMSVTASGRIVTVNRAAEEMLNAGREQIVDALLGEVCPAVYQAFREACDDETPSGAVHEAILQTDGERSEPRVLEIQTRPAVGLPDQPAHHLLIMKDVTELRRLERAANLRNRLTAMGEMAMNVAHEVRNPLGSIELFASALRQEVRDEPERMRLVDYISQGVRSIDNIVGNILTFARQLNPTLDSVDPKSLMDDVLAYACFHIEQKEITLDRKDLANGARCLGDVELLKQVFLNLLLNATQAMSPGGRLRLENHATPRYVAFIVEDNGSGIPPENLARIFDPFFTTKRRGTGLGLSICHNIIQAHQGTIEVESEPGVGTRFTVRVPRA